MRTERSRREWRFAELVDAFPLNPINDHRSYARAIQILDQLFLLEREQSRDESEYFTALAEIVYEYESQKALDRVDYLDHRLECERLQAEHSCRHT